MDILQQVSGLPGPGTTRAAKSFPLWSNNALLDFFLVRLRLPAYAAAGVVIGIYWFIPLFLAAWDGTLLHATRAQALVNFLRDLGVPSSLMRIPQAFANYQRLNTPQSLPYLQDVTHFLFATILSVGTFVATLTIRNFDRTLERLGDNGIPHVDAREITYIYKNYRDHVFQTNYILLCAILGMVGSALFIYLHTSPQYAFWWGSRQNGIAGLVFSFIVGGMVFAVLWGTILLVGGSLMLARIMRFPIELTPFHSDGCNGLSPLGRQIFLLWLNAFLGSLAIYVALRLGYLGIEHNPLVWVLAMLGSLAVPALAVLPLVASLQAVKETQGANLERLGRFLNSQLAIAASAIGKGDLDGANKIISQLSEVKSLFEIYKAANVWPFNPRALMFIVTANCVQIILTSRQLLSLMPN